MLPEATQQDFPQWRKALQVHPVWQKVPGGGAISGRRVSLSVIIITLLSFCHYHAPPINHPATPTPSVVLFRKLKMKSYRKSYSHQL